MDRSEQLNELAGALVKAQAEIEDAAKDGNNPHFRSAYATLGSVWDACKPALTKHGLSVVQTCEPSETGALMNLTTTLIHSSGQFLSGTMSVPLQKMDAQGFGAAMTYGRRYGLAAIVGVCPDDDDGNAAVSQNRQNAPSPPATGVWEGPGQCPSCHAPEGKRHGKPCVNI